MTGNLRPPGAYVHGLSEPVVVVPARVAAWLDRAAGLDRLRQQAVGDPAVGSVLAALALLSANWAVTARTGTAHRQSPEPAAALTPMTTSQAAAHLGMTERGVRTAIADGRLLATRNAAGHWRIARTDLEQYRAARAA